MTFPPRELALQEGVLGKNKKSLQESPIPSGLDPQERLRIQAFVDADRLHGDASAAVVDAGPAVYLRRHISGCNGCSPHAIKSSATALWLAEMPSSTDSRSQPTRAAGASLALISMTCNARPTPEAERLASPEQISRPKHGRIQKNKGGAGGRSPEATSTGSTTCLTRPESRGRAMRPCSRKFRRCGPSRTGHRSSGSK